MPSLSNYISVPESQAVFLAWNGAPVAAVAPAHAIFILPSVPCCTPGLGVPVVEARCRCREAVGFGVPAASASMAISGVVGGVVKCALVVDPSLICKGKDAVFPPCSLAVGGRLHAWRCGNEVLYVRQYRVRGLDHFLKDVPLLISRHMIYKQNKNERKSRC